MSDKKIEAFALSLSTYGYAAMAVAGLVFAGLTGSGAIMLDGAYSLVSFMMTLLAARVARLVEVPDSDDFQFGYAYFEPMLNTIRGLLILAIVAFGVGAAVLALFSGGRPLSAGLALIYSIILGTICVGLSVVQRRHARLTESPLLEVDARNWFVDGMLTIAVGIAFLVALLLTFTRWADWVPFIDPIVVIVLGLAILYTPLTILRRNAGELLHVAPDARIQQEVRHRMEIATANLGLRRRDVRMVKVGRYFYVLAKLIVDDDFPCSHVRELDRIREQVAQALSGCHPRLVLDVVFTTDERWVLGLVDASENATSVSDDSGTPSRE